LAIVATLAKVWRDRRQGAVTNALSTVWLAVATGRCATIGGVVSMADPFDPYHVWLGIPPDLLGIPLFEQNPDVIAHAADKRMRHLRSFQAGARSADSQRLLNQVAAARVCLLNEKKKADYDRQLRAAIQSATAQPPEAPPCHADAPAPPPPPTLAPPVPGAKSPAPTPPVAPGAGRAQGVAEQMTVLGDYQLLEKLGQGGMGAVYKARHVRLGREVAVKVLSTGRLADQHPVARFEREMQAVGRVNHANIVQALDAREIEGTRFLVMELLEGMDLEQVLRRAGPLPVADACEVVRQAALGLQCAHEAGLVHRDVKPSNLMLTSEGHVKLLDLGLARFESKQPRGQMTSAGHALSTLDYMAPEQAEDTHQAYIRADIYNAGCSGWAITTPAPCFGFSPFRDSARELRGSCVQARTPKSCWTSQQWHPVAVRRVIGRVGEAAGGAAAPTRLVPRFVTHTQCGSSRRRVPTDRAFARGRRGDQSRVFTSKQYRLSA